MTNELPQTHTLAESFAPDSDSDSDSDHSDASATDSPSPDADADADTDADTDTDAQASAGETPSSESSAESTPSPRGPDLTAGDHATRSSTPSHAQSEAGPRRPVPVPHEDPQLPHDPRYTGNRSDTGDSGSDTEPTVAHSWTGLPDIVIPRCPDCGGVGTVSHYSIAEQDGLLNAHCSECSSTALVDPNPDE